ncbi:helix-turn-helix domain-containing protein [Pelagibacterium xiamenense]|uniref:helix-turn-helix domain-containing protein n=1 Tax=Pelagibacterium xiamenense TaxID=2901140 RepID=UPI001E420DE1|nr:helix-turn-helix domain-containing protein [Pelagibacterium xiamenense]MCD7060000.1 helix-turn-helix domain-containing protein [Pelagibacterium xiamenense]
MANEQQRKPENGFRQISTTRFPEAERFDYWRSLFPRVSLELTRRDRSARFRGEMLHYRGTGGETFALAYNDDTTTHFGKPDGAFVLLSVTISGSAMLIDATGAERVVTPKTGIVVMDSSRPLTTHTREHRQFCLTVPRARVAVSLGGERAVGERGAFVLPESGLGHFVLEHLRTLAGAAGTLGADEAQVAMGAAVDLTAGALAQATPRSIGVDEVAGGSAVLEAAKRYIALHLSEPGLTAADIAGALGCSRAQLFRVFERHGASIGGSIRSARLAYAAHLLVAHQRLNIDQIAYRCGYTSAASFARAFRAHAGCTPQAYRHECGQ